LREFAWTGARVGVAGHSLGGYTVLGLAGGWPSWKDPRIRAVLAPSPYSSPYLSKEQRANLNIPVMYQGGTGDSVVTPTVKKSGGAYDQSAKPKYYIEFDGAGHFAWTHLNRTYVASINKYSVPFYDAYLKGQKGRPDQTVKCRPSQGRQRFTLRRVGLLTRDAACATP
jgi:predicted dienelactone hydrolase